MNKSGKQRGGSDRASHTAVPGSNHSTAKIFYHNCLVQNLGRTHLVQSKFCDLEIQFGGEDLVASKTKKCGYFEEKQSLKSRSAASSCSCHKIIFRAGIWTHCPRLLKTILSHQAHQIIMAWCPSLVWHDLINNEEKQQNPNKANKEGCRTLPTPPPEIPS